MKVLANMQPMQYISLVEESPTFKRGCEDEICGITRTARPWWMSSENGPSTS